MGVCSIRELGVCSTRELGVRRLAVELRLVLLEDAEVGVFRVLKGVLTSLLFFLPSTPLLLGVTFSGVGRSSDIMSRAEGARLEGCRDSVSLCAG